MAETRERMGVGQRLRELRQAAGLSQSQLGAAAGVLTGQVSALERGANQPSLGMLVRLASGLGVPLREFDPETAHLPSWPEGCERPEDTGGTVGKRLRIIRRALGMTQTELSGVSGVSPQAVSRIEASRKVSISWPTLIALAEALNVNLDAFIGE